MGKAGFITTLYIIFVPFLGVFARKKVRGIVWGAAVLAAVGMYFLCMTESFVLSAGDTLITCCAVVFAVHIIAVDHFAPQCDGPVVAGIQFLVCGLVCTVCAFIWEEPGISQLSGGLSSLLYTGVLSCGVAYTLQIVGQKGVDPTVAALIMSLESVVAALAGYAAYRLGFLSNDQTLSAAQVAGCFMVFAAIVLVQLPPQWFDRKIRQNSAIK